MEFIHYLVWFVCGFFCGATLMRDKINRETRKRYEEMLNEMKTGRPRVREIKENDE